MIDVAAQWLVALLAIIVAAYALVVFVLIEQTRLLREIARALNCLPAVKAAGRPDRAA